MSIPVNGFTAVLESWGRGGLPQTWFLLRTLVGSFELWHGEGLDGRIVAAAQPHAQVSIEDAGLARHAQTWTREDAARAFVARVMKAAIGGQDGWHPCYHGSVIIAGLGVNRFDAASRFREFAPADLPAASAPAEPDFDPNDFKARLAARRRQAAAAAQVASDLKVEREGGIRRVKAFRAPAETMLADLPVVGLSAGGAPVPGRIHSCNPQYAVVEALVADLDRVTGPLTWVYDPKNPFTVGVTAADHK